jgi:acetyl-CoA acetyltransferase
MRDPLDLDTYLASRYVSEPLRLYDCCLETDGAVAVVLVSTTRARDLRRRPVLVSSATTGGGHSFFSGSGLDYSVSGARAMAPRLFDAAGFGPDELDLAEIYDAFTPLVLMQLEDYGICPDGESAAMVADGETTVGGSLPVNTHGGHLSEGYVHGLNHVAEAVDQLRGTAAGIEVPGAETALCTGQPGYVSGVCSALLLRRGDDR